MLLRGLVHDGLRDDAGLAGDGHEFAVDLDRGGFGRFGDLAQARVVDGLDGVQRRPEEKLGASESDDGGEGQDAGGDGDVLFLRAGNQTW